MGFWPDPSAWPHSHVGQSSAFWNGTEPNETGQLLMFLGGRTSAATAATATLTTCDS